MPKNEYFGHYPNPNLIIVPTKPTVNSCHPPPPTGWVPIADLTTSTPAINCEQISPIVKDNIGYPSPYVSNCNQQNLQFMNAEAFFRNPSIPEFSENFQNPPLIYHNPISAQASSSNMSKSIKELSASKYKSRNNLVDLTGFNLLKRDSASPLTKRQDSKQIDDTKIEPDKTKNISEKVLPPYSDEFAKNMKPMIINGEGNPENLANDEPEEHTKGNMKEYLRKLLKRNFEKFKEKETRDRVIKSSSSKKIQESKKSKHESSKTKAHLQISSKRNSTSTKDLKNKIKEGSKKYHDFERLIDKYPKSSKSVTNSLNLQDSNVSKRDAEKDLSPDAIQRYKDFQCLIRNCDDDKIKYKSGNQLKTKSLPRKKIRIESCKTKNIKRKIDVKMKLDELKQYLKSEKNSKVSTMQTSLENDNNYTYIEKASDQTNTDKPLIKNIIRGDRNLADKLSQRVGVEGLQDLRSKLSRKRSRSDRFVLNQEPMEKSLDPETLVLSVKQDVEAGSKNSPILAPPFDEPKAKKCKPIELIKNIKCPESASGDIDQDLPEDLSFLDDLILHTDEIVASLPRSNKFEPLLCSSLTMTKTDYTKSELIKKINTNGNKDNEEANPKKILNNDDHMEPIEIKQTNGYYSKNNEEIKFKQDLNNYDSMKTIEIIQEEETSLHKMLENYNNKIYYSKNNEEIKRKEGLISNMKVKEINSNAEGGEINFEIGSIAYTKKHEDVKNMNQKSNNVSNRDEENNNTDMAEKVYEEIGQKEAMRICKDIQKIIITITGIKTKKKANNTADLTGKDYEEIAPKITSRCKTKQKMTTDSNYEIDINVEANNMVHLTEKANEENAPKETNLCKAKQKITTDSKYDFTGEDYEEIMPKETTSPCNAKENIVTNSEYEVNIIQGTNDVTDLTGNDYEEITPKETTSPCNAKENIITNSEYEVNIIQGANGVTNLTKNDYEEITPKETTSPCNVKKNIITNSEYEVKIIQGANDVTDLTGNDYEKIAPKNTRRLSKNKKIKTNSKYEINTNKNKKHANYITDLTGKDLRVDLCDDSDDSVVEMVDITDENEHNRTSKNYWPNVNRTFVINKSNFNKRTDLVSNAKALFREHDGKTPLDTRRVAFGTQVKQKSEASNADPKQTQLQSVLSIEPNKSINNFDVISDVLKQGNTLDKHVKNKNNDNSKDTVEASLEKMFTNSDQNGSILKHIEPNQIHGCAKNPKENSLQKSVDTIVTLETILVSLETIFSDTNKQDTDIYKPSLSDQLINKEIVEDILKTAQSTIKKQPETIINMLDQDKNENEKIEIELSNGDKHITIETKAQASVNQTLQETTKNSIEPNVAIQIDTSPLKVSNIQENLSQKSAIDIAPLCRSDKSFKEQVQTFEDASNKLANKSINDIEKKTQNVSETSTKETPETVTRNLAQNIEAETLKISEESNHISSSTTIVTTKLGQKAYNRIESSTSDKNAEKKTTSLETSELIISEESQDKRQDTCRTRIEYKADVTTSEIPKPDKNTKDKSEKSEVVSNTKKVINKSLVPDGRKNKDETKSNEQERQLSPRPRNYLLQLELRMSEYLHKESKISSVINFGRYSTIYKCIDTKGGAYALKVVSQRQKGLFMEGIFRQLQQYRPKQDSCILYLMNAFQFKDKWCLLTEYFPQNLEEVLNENKRGFHIDQVQFLSRQLVNAVTMMANASIIHSDIKPKHILLNSAQDRLKLCGFDRSSYFSIIKISPSTGSPKYRAPEVILGFHANHKIDVWTTGLVIFEMATNKSLFNASFNNGLLYEQISTFGSFNWTMIQKSKYKDLYFSGLSFIRRFGPTEHQAISVVHYFERNNNLRKTLFDSYYQYWVQNKSKWQITKETDKLETLHTLLEQMLALDPRYRLPIQFVNASQFMNHKLNA